VQGVSRVPYPFAAIVGQNELKQSLLLTAIDPSIGGVLAFGDRGTGKSTAIRGLAALLPSMKAVAGCPYHCEPRAKSAGVNTQCPFCSQAKQTSAVTMAVPVVDLPLGASEDRVLGALDLEKALSKGVKAFEPGLLAAANRGYLYIDEVNLLDDHLVDLLIDVAASGENVVERDGLSVRHPARFVLVGSGNPEEGELRPQLLDRFGLSCEIKTPTDIQQRVDIIKRRDAFERNPSEFSALWEPEALALQKQITQARKRLPNILVSDELHLQVAQLCVTAGTDGLRGELTLLRSVRALTAMQGKTQASIEQLREVAPLALRHRLRRDPMDDAGSTARVLRAVEQALASA
jgi:magnesium chelatase subunit I